MALLEKDFQQLSYIVLLSCSRACVAGATERLLWMSGAQGDDGRALATGTDWTAPAPAPVRNTQAPHKHTHLLHSQNYQINVPISSHHGETAVSLPTYRRSGLSQGGEMERGGSLFLAAD